jgi:pimeloyl-ACP methyl ester carboxylesterase
MPILNERGFPIYYEVHGEGEGDPLLYVTGPGASCRGWKYATVPDLSLDRRNVVFDGRGVGESGDPGEDYTTVDVAEDALAVMDHLRIERAHIIGTLLAGMAAQELAIRHPHRVRSLILCGTASHLTNKLRLIMEIWRDSLELHVPRELRVRNWIVWHIGDIALEQPGFVDELLRFQLERDIEVDDEAYAAMCAACLAHDTRGRLDQIDVPTLVACGDRDILTPVELHRELANRIPRARLVVFQGIGHVVAFEAVHRFNRMVRRFMAEVEGRRLSLAAPASPPGLA